MTTNIIINKPTLKSFFMRMLEAIFSTTVWVAFLYFFQPLFTTIVWLITGHWIQLHFFSTSLIEPLLDILLYSLLFSLLILIVLLSWSSWNSWRYGGLDRRKSRPMVSDLTIAVNFSVPFKTITTARNAKLALVEPALSGASFTVITTNSPDFIPAPSNTTK